MELVIDFKPTGAVNALHMDDFDLGFLGDKKVRRQTDIVFHEASQKWDIIYIDSDGKKYYDSGLCGFESYDLARKFEVKWINDCRLLGLDPTSREGIEVLRDLRDKA